MIAYWDPEFKMHFNGLVTTICFLVGIRSFTREIGWIPVLFLQSLIHIILVMWHIPFMSEYCIINIHIWVISKICFLQLKCCDYEKIPKATASDLPATCCSGITREALESGKVTQTTCSSSVLSYYDKVTWVQNQ